MEDQIKNLIKTSSLNDGVFGSLFGNVSFLVQNINGIFYISYYTKTKKQENFNCKTVDSAEICIKNILTWNAKK